MISVLILTLNEEQALPDCLASVKWCDDVVVFDSFSTDRTNDIARAAGARVVQHAFANYGAQREAARTIVQYKHPWVLALDADERIEPELVTEIQSIASQPVAAHAAYRLRRRDYFMGRWIRHVTLYPSWFVRFYQPDQIQYEPRGVHEYPTLKGSLGELSGHLVHQNFSKGIGQWVLRHNLYAGLEASENLKALETTAVQWGGLFSSNAVRRRRALKGLSFRLPFRPALRFLYMYFLRFGILDGLPGYHYCRLLAFYEYLIVLKMKEIRRRRAGLPV
jgi:glycosyltransferase involved in cell wall biosynthesis